MEGTCVACGEVAEGKPIYKKLGSNNLKVEVYDALIEMQLLSLPKRAKTECYICWDCDETVAEEYMNFVETESKRKSDEKKQKEQDLARNQKLNKKLNQAFKKAHKESMISKGDIPPVSKYRQKEQKKVANRYYASNCLLCRNAFKSSKVGFLRFNLKKMVDDRYTVYEVLQKLGTEHVLDANQQMRRYICCQCYNKVRRNYKANIPGQHVNPIGNTPYTNGGAEHDALKRPTFDEHAAEIAKLIPPGLADMYKVIGKNDPKQGKGSMKKLDVLDDLSYTESDTDSSSSDDSGSETNNWNTSPNTSTIRTFIPKKDASSHNGPPTESHVCSVCGLCYNGRPKSFWHSLMDDMPSVSNLTVTIFSALQALEMRLTDVNKLRSDKEYVCTPCYSRICTGFRSKIYQSIALKKGKAYGSLDTSKMQIDVVSPNSDRRNGVEQPPCDAPPRPLSIKKKMAGNFVPVGKQSFQSGGGSRFGHKRSLMTFATAPSYNSNHPRWCAANNEIVKKDLHLLNIINKSQHLRFKGQAVYLNSVDVNVIDVGDAISDHLPIVCTERLTDFYRYSNFMRSVRNKFNGKCMLCLTKIKEDISLWLEDPVCPPYLMVPLRWARLSLGPPDESTNFSSDDGKVCTNCYDYVKIEFTKFVSNKIGLSLDDESASAKKYKVSFDSVAMSIVADPLQPIETDTSEKSDSPRSVILTSENDRKSPSEVKNVHSKKENILDCVNKRKQKSNFGVKNRSHRKDSTDTNQSDESDSSVSDNESVSSSISNYSDESVNRKVANRNRIRNAGNINDNSQSNITQFKATENVSSKANKDNVIKNFSDAKTPNKTGLKRKRDLLATDPDEISDSKKQRLNEVKYNEPIIQFGRQNKKRFFEDDQFDQDYFQSSEDSVAPFAQRKKIRTGPAPCTAIKDTKHNHTNTIAKSYENIWQILQEISIDCLLSSNEAQPVKPESFTYGFLCSLNFIKDEIGASDNDVVQWLCKVFPTEFRNLGRKLCKEAVLSYLKEIYVEEEQVKIDTLNEALPLSFYVSLKAKKSEKKCCFENVLNIGYHKKTSVDWHHYLQVVNMDNLIDNKAERLSSKDFNSGLVYSLWRANEYFGGCEDNLILWMRQTAPEEIPYNCCQILARNAKNSHSFISEYPSILINLNVPIVASKKDLQQVVFINKTSYICYISRLNGDETIKNDIPLVEKTKLREISNIPVSLQNIKRNMPQGNDNRLITDKQNSEIFPVTHIGEASHGNVFPPGIVYRDNIIVGQSNRPSQESALLRFNQKEKAVTIASTSKGNPINIDGSMQLIPVVQPSGIVTLVPVQISTPPVLVLSPAIRNLSNPFSMSLDQLPQMISGTANINRNFQSGDIAIRLNNTEELSKRVEELERKLKEAEEEKVKLFDVNKQLKSEKRA